jgi:hypothetical protein
MALLLLQTCFAHQNLPLPSSDLNQSFAQQYSELANLLSRVENRQSALDYRSKIQQQIDMLANSQSSGEDKFNQMSKQEQRLFIKRFQNNRYHCGAVTQVMQERQRILLDPELAELLQDLLIKIP